MVMVLWHLLSALKVLILASRILISADLVLFSTQGRNTYSGDKTISIES